MGRQICSSPGRAHAGEEAVVDEAEEGERQLWGVDDNDVADGRVRIVADEVGGGEDGVRLMDSSSCSQMLRRPMAERSDIEMRRITAVAARTPQERRTNVTQRSREAVASHRRRW